MHDITTNAAGHPQRLESSGAERTLLREGVDLAFNVQAEGGRVVIRVGDRDSLHSSDITLSREAAMGLAARLVGAVKAAGGGGV